jgi:hypothetical protein
MYQERKPDDQRVEGLNPSNPSKQRNRNWYRGACMFCGRSVDTKCEQCRVWLCCVKDSFENGKSVAAEDGSDDEEEADEDI